mmetsp:Transcript_5202/g.11524  ORF Transcript_5202/g.11524 Transcript_5202/m.11524 type:complete len:273 (+) Transcript_5202:483-1301(+)
MVVREGLKHRRQHALGDQGRVFKGVVAVHQHLRLHNGHQAARLADSGVPRKRRRVLVDRKLRRGRAERVLDVEHRPPLGEASTLLVVRGAPLGQLGDTLGHGLAVGSVERLYAHVHLDPRDHALLFEQVNQLGLTIGRLVVERLLEENDARDVLAEALGAEEHLAIRPAVVLVVLDLNLREALADGAWKDFARRGGVSSGRVLAKAARHAAHGVETATRGGGGSDIRSAESPQGRLAGGWCARKHGQYTLTHRSTRRRRGCPCLWPRWHGLS